MIADPVLDVLDALAVPYALIGAHAMAARGYPRFTADLDFLTTDTRVIAPAVWAKLVKNGASVDPRQGDADDPLAGVVHILLPDATDVDVVVGRWAWETGVVARADRLPLMGRSIPVARVADLILLKLAAGGYLDRHDAAALLALGSRHLLVQDVEAHIDEVRPPVRTLWRELLDAVPEE